jgi:hypothetical protein
MSKAAALDSLPDPLITPLLQFLQIAVNADLREQMATVTLQPGVEAEDVIQTIAPRPLDLLVDGDGKLPMLGCVRTKVRSKQVTFGFKENYTTLRFYYFTPATNVDQLGERWPLLNRVWESMIRALEVGKHDDYHAGADLLEELQITWVNFESATKQELHAERGQFAFPAFIGDIEIRTRMAAAWAGTLYPTLSFLTKMFQGPAETGRTREPQVQVLDFTETGKEERDSDPNDDEQELEVAV